MNFVLDSSLALSWCLDGEETRANQAVLATLTSATAIVPTLWAWEVNNVLCLALKQKRISPARRQRALSLLASLPIEVDEFAHRRAAGETAELAIKHGLTVYDAAYLEMALRLRLPLGSLDAQLRTAASKSGVRCLPDTR